MYLLDENVTKESPSRTPQMITTQPVVSSEQDMQNTHVPWVSDSLELREYIDGLVNRTHDYGTCVHAASMAAVAAFQYVSSKLEMTGFQASCADLDVIRRTRRITGPFMLLQMESELYRDGVEKKVAEFLYSEENQAWLKEQAKEKVDKLAGYAHPDVISWWIRLAYGSDRTSPGAQLAALKHNLCSQTWTAEFVELNATKFKEAGFTDVYLIDGADPGLATIASDGCAHRIEMPVSISFGRELEGVKMRWTVETETPNANGSKTYHFDYDLLGRLRDKAVGQPREFIEQYIERAKAQEQAVAAGR